MSLFTKKVECSFKLGMCTSTRLIDYSNASAGSSMKMMIDFFFFFFFLLSLFLIGYAGIWAVV